MGALPSPSGKDKHGKRSVSELPLPPSLGASLLQTLTPDTHCTGVSTTIMSMLVAFLLLWGEASWGLGPWGGKGLERETHRGCLRRSPHGPSDRSSHM